MEPDDLMTDISEQMSISLKSMAKAKTPEERLIHSEIVKNLSGSLGVFLNLMSDMALIGDDDGSDLF